jgi:mono/diheme cytochrome c family protein
MTKLTGVSVTAFLFLLAAASSHVYAQAKAKAASPRSSDSLVERGKYIVENVAMCERCHTPRDSRGVAERDQWLKGGPLQLQQTYPVATWATREPRIAGGPAGTDDQFITLMTTGISRTGAPLNLPMPQFRMTREDAQAVLAYLKSLR